MKSAYPTLYAKVADYYESIGDAKKARESVMLTESFSGALTDSSPFYHGTKTDLQVGDLLIAGGKSNYEEDFKMNHIYFTANPNGAGLAAALAKGDGSDRVYIVEPTGEFENDPNVTDKKYPEKCDSFLSLRKTFKDIG